MQQSSQHHLPETAILLFSRSAVEESRIKSFDSGNGGERNRAIVRSLIRHSHSAAQKTGLPVFTCFSNKQKGHSFGERLTNAIDSIFKLGFQKVITIGNDCPDISSGILLEARNRLRNENMVLGPAFDGGVYLIGLDRNAWNPGKFQNLPWQSVELNKAFAAYGPIVDWMEQLRDLDDQQDLQSFLKEAPVQHRIRLEIAKIIGHSVNYNFYTTSSLFYEAPIHSHLLRGPPH